MGKRPDYRLKSGEKVDSVTTIIGRMIAKPALVTWANKEGLAGRNIKDDKAANIGTLAHWYIEQFLKTGGPVGSMPEPRELEEGLSLEDIDKALNSFAMFRDWYTSNQLTTLHNELVLVSEIFHYGGTMDWVLKRQSDGAIWIVDFKTSGEIYPEYILQLAAYRQLFQENYDDCQVHSCHILRIDKKAGGFDHCARMGDMLDKAFETFRLIKEANYILKEIK